MRLRGATVIDGIGGEPHRGDVTTDGSVISHVGDASGTQDGGDVDLSDLTLLPGLIDAHTHLGIVDNKVEGTPLAIVAAQIARNCSLALDAGFTSVRDMGGVDGGYAQAVAMGLVRGPRIWPSGPIISEAGGNGDLEPACSCSGRRWNQGVPGLSRIGEACRGSDDVRFAARMALRRGATQVKLSLNTLSALIADGPRGTEFTLEEVKAAVWEAQAKGTYVTAHTTNDAGVRLALDGGVRCLEHGGIGSEETAAAVAEAGLWVVPTFAQQWIHANEPGPWATHSGAFVEEMRQSMLLARAHGIRIGLGSDLEGAEQHRRGLELVLRARFESPMDAIRAATSINADLLGRPDLGRVAVGAQADLIAVRGDPLAEPELFDDPDRVVLVVQAGVVVKDTR